MSSGIYLLLVLFSCVVQPVLLVEELLAARAALENMPLVGILCVLYKLVIAPKFSMAVFAFSFLVVQEAHRIAEAYRWL